MFTCETGINIRYFNEEYDFSNKYQLFQNDAFECDSDFNLIKFLKIIIKLFISFNWLFYK